MKSCRPDVMEGRRLLCHTGPLRRLARQRVPSRAHRRFESTDPQSASFKSAETKCTGTTPSASRAANTKASEARTRSRVERVVERLPGFLRRYTSGLRDAPVTHVVSFLVLHEITAVVPLFGLTAWFHYIHWLPPVISESKYIADGIEKFGRYFRRKGWFGFNNEGGPGMREKMWNVSEGASRFLVEVATAYAITKAMLPARLMLSVWGTPWFARVVIGRLGGAARKVFGRKKAVVKGAPGEKL